MGRKQLSEADLRRQYQRGLVLEARDRSAGRRAATASYDQANRRVVLELSDGHVFAFPVATIPGLDGATDAQVAAVKATPGGYGLHWESLDVELSVPGLLTSTIGRSWKLSELARVAGQSTSPAKAAAARSNGRRGGRPPGARRARQR